MRPLAVLALAMLAGCLQEPLSDPAEDPGLSNLALALERFSIDAGSG